MELPVSKAEFEVNLSFLLTSDGSQRKKRWLPLERFIEANDFTGKTVVPFCTFSSSGLGESGELLAEAAGTGNWLEGERFSSGVSEETVQTWVEDLGI